MRVTASLLWLVAAVAVGACGGERDRDEIRGTPDQATIAEIVRDPGEPGRDVRVSGTAFPIGEAGFILVGDDAALFVDVAPSEAEKVDPGEQLQVQGDVQRQDGGTAIQVQSQLDGTDCSAAPVVEQALTRAPVGRGEPYIADASITGEGGDDGSPQSSGDFGEGSGSPCVTDERNPDLRTPEEP